MRQAAADGAARAHGAVADAAGDPAQEAAGRIIDAAVFDGRVGHDRADGDELRVFRDGRQLRDARDVDDEPRLGEAQVEHRPQRLPARQHLGVGPAAEQGNGLANRPRPRVLEGCRLHAAAFPRARSTASAMRRGVIGDTSSSTPRPFSASLTALVMAAGGAMAPPSPRPFCPKRV